MHPASLSRYFIAAAFALWGAAAMLSAAPAFGKQSPDVEKRSGRQVVMAAEYPGVVIAPGEDVGMDLIFYNKGIRDENIDVRVTEKPAGWRTAVKTYRYQVTSVHVPPDGDKTLTFEAQPPEDAAAGQYHVRIEARTRDGRLQMAQTIRVTVRPDEEASKSVKGVKLTTSYPVIRGPSDAKFEFSIEVVSRLDQDAIFDLSARGPEGWDVNFKPAYETKFISSLRLKAKQSQSIAVEVRPSPQAQAGEYPVMVRVQSGDAAAESVLKVILTGTYDLEVGTASGLLSLDARQGKTAHVSFYIKNVGSAANHNIRFLSFKPENWNVTFAPEQIGVIAPGELKQVDANITPYDEALLGDYAVNVKIEGEKAAPSLEFRVTVKASAAWGWVGIFIIAAVIAGLIGLFRWLGRR